MPEGRSPEFDVEPPKTVFDAAGQRFNEAALAGGEAFGLTEDGQWEELALVQAGTPGLGLTIRRMADSGPEQGVMTIDLEERYEVDTHSSLRAIRFMRNFIVTQTVDEDLQPSRRCQVFEMRTIDGQAARRDLTSRESRHLFALIMDAEIRR